MLYNSFYGQDEMTDSRQMPGVSYIRIFHAAPGAPEVDVYANGKQVAKRLVYGQFTDYMSVSAGMYTIEAFPVGLKDSPVLSVRIPILEKKVYTLAVIGILPRIGILPVEDEYQALSPNRVNIRFINLSPNAPALDLALRSGMRLFTDIGYTEASQYMSLLPGNYNMVVKPTEVDTAVVNLPNVRLLPKRNLTFYVLGMFGQQPSSLEVYIPMDGTTYLRD
ncbi:uncharacterized protein DUF4397 [Ruminiclostridium sufflavum DSM 19573]|uniref:Uncharacterized protein DUF4397 n=1 Tax=Ruminiclostridium sufflavum DSM 19573 TaxID=1121337 RepID=A0A318Y5K7_9FIRM|nr:DUF4397 domain-containing protein [Ruminiclostridium sufflavum]PYG87276.1 uncharacterized protein DUF4397 [Ruminiclostridium sufflavum DSM 19573]